MLQITLDMERLRNPYSGLGQYCLQLGTALAALPDTGVHFEYLLPKASRFEFGAAVRTRHVSRLAQWIPVKTKAALWHCTHQDSAYWPRGKQTPVVMTIHDLNFLERADYSNLKKRFKLWQLQRKVNRCKGLVYISHFVKKWANAHLKIPAGVLERVIHNGNNLSDQTVPMQRPGWGEWPPFLFSIGIHPKKNYAALLPLLAQLPQHRWVIAGTDGKGYRQAMEAGAAALGASDRLVFTGPVDEPEKKWLFEHCEALLFPSLSEGFGRPVVEAMWAGKPVFLSKATSLPEIGGAEAFYFDDFSAENQYKTFVNGMETYKKDGLKAQRMKVWSEQFNWHDTAKAYLAFYQSAISE